MHYLYENRSKICVCVDLNVFPYLAAVSSLLLLSPSSLTLPSSPSCLRTADGLHVQNNRRRERTGNGKETLKKTKHNQT